MSRYRRDVPHKVIHVTQHSAGSENKANMDLLMVAFALIIAAAFLAIFIVPDYILYRRRVNSIPTATISHIQLSTKEDAQAVKDIIQDKESDKEDEYGRFCTAAKVRSTCKTGKEDFGNLGVFTYGDLELPTSFSDFVFHDKIGTTLGPVESEFGWHLIFVRERHDPDKRLSKFTNDNDNETAAPSDSKTVKKDA